MRIPCHVGRFNTGRNDKTLGTARQFGRRIARREWRRPGSSCRIGGEQIAELAGRFTRI
jgi:hypothetical protein